MVGMNGNLKDDLGRATDSPTRSSILPEFDITAKVSIVASQASVE